VNRRVTFIGGPHKFIVLVLKRAHISLPVFVIDLRGAHPITSLEYKIELDGKFVANAIPAIKLLLIILAVRALPHHGRVSVIINSIIPGVCDGLADTKEGVGDNEIEPVAVYVDIIDGSVVGILNAVTIDETVRVEFAVKLGFGRALVPLVDVDTGEAEVVAVTDVDELFDAQALDESDVIPLPTAVRE
jgi:hypothetical protein